LAGSIAGTPTPPSLPSCPLPPRAMCCPGVRPGSREGSACPGECDLPCVTATSPGPTLTYPQLSCHPYYLSPCPLRLRSLHPSPTSYLGCGVWGGLWEEVSSMWVYHAWVPHYSTPRRCPRWRSCVGVGLRASLLRAGPSSRPPTTAPLHLPTSPWPASCRATELWAPPWGDGGQRGEVRTLCVVMDSMRAVPSWGKPTHSANVLGASAPHSRLPMACTVQPWGAPAHYR
jgi:hypothetical protein